MEEMGSEKNLREYLSLVQKNLRHYGSAGRVGLRRVRCVLRRPVLRQPVFVVGCSRAGTTLVYKTLSESRQLGTLQKETHDFWSTLHPPAERGWDSHGIPAGLATSRDRDTVSRFFYIRTGRCRIVDKNNQNGLSIPYLQRLFPDAHFVFIRRSPGDNIHSLIQGWGKADRFGTWADQLPEQVRVEEGRYRRWCFFLAPGWRRLTHAPIEEVCAFQYTAMNEAILDARETIPPGQWHELRYESLLADPVAGFRAVIEGCGLEFDRRLEQHCRQVLDTPYNSFSEIRADKWKSGEHRARIERVLPSLERIAARLGYSLP